MITTIEDYDNREDLADAYLGNLNNIESKVRKKNKKTLERYIKYVDNAFENYNFLMRPIVRLGFYLTGESSIYNNAKLRLYELEINL